MPRLRIWQKMYKRFGIRGKFLRVIIDLYKDTTGQAIVNELNTRTFPISSGVLQDSVLGYAVPSVSGRSFWRTS